MLGQYITSGSPSINSEIKNASLRTTTAKNKTKGIINLPNIGKLEIELQHTPAQSQGGSNLTFNKIYYTNLQGKKHVIYDKKIHTPPKQIGNP